MINIIDFRMGNLRSVEKAFHHLGFDAAISKDPADIPSADHLVLPGDGAFGKSMEHIREMGFEGPIRDFISSGRPFLGICVGFQLLFEASDEIGCHNGLGLLPGTVKKFPPGKKIPHMGWNQVAWQHDSLLAAGIPEKSWFYFVHSYYAEAEESAHVLGLTDYGFDFASIVERENMFAVQFHPEKSQEAGLRLLKNFAEI
ncbi:MAG: imidazole glycerol phosphate synthase subunit HisH [Gemmatimonadota bacterium]|nr:imidazole glycerol phosphate synthase subunit HisH [Gemmatimonadota bacterium]